jgi:hypothetical protein
MLSPGAVAEVNKDFDEIEQELRAQDARQLCASGAAWKFERRQGIIADELIAAGAAIGEARSGETVAIIVGSSSHAAHRGFAAMPWRQPHARLNEPASNDSGDLRDRHRAAGGR